MATHPRPLSPHLQVYKPQLTSVLSILHRATGVTLCAGALGLVWGLLALSIGREEFEHFRACANSAFGKLFTAAFVFCLVYHFLNGIRHLAWDTGWGLDLKRAYVTGWTLVAAAPLLTALALYWIW